MSAAFLAALVSRAERTTAPAEIEACTGIRWKGDLINSSSARPGGSAPYVYFPSLLNSKYFSKPLIMPYLAEIVEILTVAKGFLCWVLLSKADLFSLLPVASPSTTKLLSPRPLVAETDAPVEPGGREGTVCRVPADRRLSSR